MGKIGMAKHKGAPNPKDLQFGQKFFEFVIVLPLLLLIAFDVYDRDRVFHPAITIIFDAREDAPYAMIRPDDVI